jgi:protein gp37
MADQRDTGISWTDKTWNPVVGCSVVSPACTNCYAMVMAARIERMSGGKTHYAGTTKTANGKPVWTGKLVMAPDHILTAPLRWKRPRRVFVNSMSDLFHDDMPEEWIDRVFAVMALSPQHTFQVLTKRPERMRAYMLERWQGTPERTISLGRGETLHVPAGGETGRRLRIEEACEPLLEEFGLVDTQNDALWTEDGRCKAMQWNWPLPNVWLGVTAEDQTRADQRIPHLLETPAAVRFVSAEPLLTRLTFRWAKWESWHDAAGKPRTINHLDGLRRLDWIIVGGESGPGARPMHPDWVREIRDQCAEAGVAFHFKQWGDWVPICNLADGESDTLYRSNRIAAEGESQLDLDEIHGRTCKVPVANLGYGGATGLDAFKMVDGKGGMTFFKLGKARAGRTLDGTIHDAFPEAP